MTIHQNTEDFNLKTLPSCFIDNAQLDALQLGHLLRLGIHNLWKSISSFPGWQNNIKLLPGRLDKEVRLLDLLLEALVKIRHCKDAPLSSRQGA